MLSADEPTEYGVLKDFSLILHGSNTSPYLGQTGGIKNMKLQVAKRLHKAQA